VNYKRKSRRRFFWLVRSRTPPISSEFRGGGVLNPETPLGTPLLRDTSMQKKTSSSVGYTIIISPVINIFPMLILFFFFGACNVWMSMSSKILQRKVLPLVSRSKYKRSNQLNQPTKTVITEEIITHLIHL